MCCLLHENRQLSEVVLLRNMSPCIVLCSNRAAQSLEGTPVATRDGYEDSGDGSDKEDDLAVV